MSNIKEVLHKTSMIQIPENALLHGVVKELKGRECFKDTENVGERIYYGDVFEQIVVEFAEKFDKGFFTPDKKVLKQLNELAKLVDTDYVQITMI